VEDCRYWSTEISVRVEEVVVDVNANYHFSVLGDIALH
jgi:hypothetical protein